MYGSGATDATDANSFPRHENDAKQVLPMKYNLIEMAMTAADATDPPATTTSDTNLIAPTTATATKCSGSHAVVSIILVLIARVVFPS